MEYLSRLQNLRENEKQAMKVVKCSLITIFFSHGRRRGSVVRAYGLHPVALGSNPVLTSGLD